MPQKFGLGDESIIEGYHQDSLEAGARIRDKLSIAVEKSIRLVANGFLKHPANTTLREQIQSKEIPAVELYKYLLRFIYRVLFLMVIEERDIIYPDNHAEKNKTLRDIYDKYYSISRIRKLSENYFFFDEKLEDLWIALRNTFRIFGDERLAGKLGIYPLDGELFDYGALGILSECTLDNHTLLECIRNLSVFESPDTKSIIRVNYGALNVEEFGSVYEGLLEKAPNITVNGSEIRFSFVESSERSSTGSHYTPEELVQPLIKHSLDYIIEDKLKTANAEWKGHSERSEESLKQSKEQALLSITVCDVACGSGHILLAAARRIAIELAKVRTGEEQPSPEPYRHAIRDVINKCIYGVDKNPLAVELCKVALWLEAHNPGMPLNFLDHKIKCGDSIVGLARIEELQNGIATEAFKTLPDDEKDIAATFRKQNKSEIENRAQIKTTDTEEITNNLNKLSVSFKEFNQLPDSTVEEVKKKQKEYDVLKGSDWMRLKELADLQVAQFFIPKTNNNKEFLTTDSEYFRIFAGQKKEVNTRKISQAMAVAAEKKFFHWFLEFPEVFAKGKNPELVEGSIGGFDCILGNPPYLGGSRISTFFGNSYSNYVTNYFENSKGMADLVSYFFRRNYSIIHDKAYQAVLSTNSISQGATRETALDYLLNMEANIIFAVKSMRWPGAAAVEISLISIFKGTWNRSRVLNNKKVKSINQYLEDNLVEENPEVIFDNRNKSYTGSKVYGEGFILEKNIALNFIRNSANNDDVLRPYISGEDINGDVEQQSNRYVINFYDWPLKKIQKEDWDELTESEKKKLRKERVLAPPDYDLPLAADYPECLNIIEQKVRPYRETIKGDKNAKEKWWQYQRIRKELYDSIKSFKRVLLIAQTTKYILPVFIPNNQVFSVKCIVFTFEKNLMFSFIQSSFHEYWAWKYGTTMGSSTLQYATELCFETFPFPQSLSTVTKEDLEIKGEEYHEFRRQLMLDTQLGLTKTYNLFHNPECNLNNVENAKEIREFKSAKLQIPLEEAIQRIEKLRELHKQMDETVLQAYGWSKNSPHSQGGETEGVNLAHNFYEVDYLPENDRVRYTISPEARKEVLKRLLELNHKIHEEEMAAGLLDKKGKKSSRKKAVDEKQGRLF